MARSIRTLQYYNGWPRDELVTTATGFDRNPGSTSFREDWLLFFHRRAMHNVSAGLTQNTTEAWLNFAASTSEAGDFSFSTAYLQALFDTTWVPVTHMLGAALAEIHQNPPLGDPNTVATIEWLGIEPFAACTHRHN